MEPAEPFDGVVVGCPGRERVRVGKRMHVVQLGVAEGHAQPREVVGDTARARDFASVLPRILAVPALRLAGGADQREGERAEPVGVDVSQLQAFKTRTPCPARYKGQPSSGG